MFQIELIHALQTLASEGVTRFMLAVSSLGYPYTLVPILVVIAFGIDFRRGFVLIHVVLWTAVLTEFLKAAFALPRPEAVDSTLLQPGDDYPEVGPFERRGAPSFWAPLPADVVAYYRGLGEFSYGFPSGHCSVTTSLWGSAALLFRERWLWFVSLSLIALMPLSRMYLARHFLAGVLGGTTVGLLVIGVAWYVAVGPVKRGRSSLLARRFETEASRFALYMVPPLLVTLVPGVELVSAVRLVGLGLGLWLLTRIGLPVEDGSLAHRFFRVVLAVVLYGLVNQGVGGLLESWLGERDTLEALVEGASGFVMTVGTVTVSYRLGWYRRGEPGSGLLGGDTASG